MLTWLVLLAGLYIAGLLTYLTLWTSAAKTSFRKTISGQVVDVRIDTSSLTNGIRNYRIVVVQTDDGQTVELRDPPYPRADVGDRVEKGLLIPRPVSDTPDPDPDPAPAQTPDPAQTPIPDPAPTPASDSE